jgi:geranylgeranyl reductase family protein
MTAAHFDVAVIGAGPAGSATAYFLARGGLRVALLDKSDFPRDKACGDGLTPRALKILDAMGVLQQVEQYAFRCSGITLRDSDEITYRLELTQPGAALQHILVLPRFTLDELLRQHAVEAGAVFFPHTKVENIRHLMDGSVRLWAEGRQAVECELAVIATGANTGLLRKTGLLKHSPRPNLAARAYFENVEGLDDTILLFFDGIQRPGYGWVFPTAPNKANIGCGVFFDSRTPQPTHLRHLIESHPYLQRILRNARLVGPIKGYPLRTDFSRSLSGAGRILVVGESVGLVNPITGEGIDYALESAQLAANAILNGQHNQQQGLYPLTIQRNYRTALNRKFSLLFVFAHLTQRVYLRDGVIDRALRRVQHRPHLQKLIVDACYGSTNPLSAFAPRTLWDVLMP